MKSGQTIKKFFISSLVICFFAVSLTLSGCDKLTFLEDFFPSLKKNADDKAPAAGDQPDQPKETVMGPDTLAKVGSWTISLREFNERLDAIKELLPDADVASAENKRLILQELIRQEMFVQDAKRSGVADDPRIQEAIDEFKRTLLVQEVITKITEEIDVSELEAREFYNENKDFFTEPTEYKIREIVTATQQGANEISIQLLQSADFAALARERSISDSAAEGGDLGYVNEADITDEKLMVALLTLEEGMLSSVFKGPKGYTIIKLEEKRGGEPQPFSEVKDWLIDQLTLERQQQAVLNYVNKLEEEIEVKTNEDLLE